MVTVWEKSTALCGNLSYKLSTGVKKPEADGFRLIFEPVLRSKIEDSARVNRLGSESIGLNP